MVYALSLEELCVSELAIALGVSLSAASHQLRILRDLEIVRVRRAGKSQLYALNERAFGFCAPRVCLAWRQTLEIDGIASRAMPGRVLASSSRAGGRKERAPSPFSGPRLRGPAREPARAPRRAARHARHSARRPAGR